MNIDNTNLVVHVDGKPYRLVPIEQEKILICEIDGKKYYLGPESNNRLDWHDAKAWTKDVGGIIMPRGVAIVASKKEEVRRHFHTDGWYWLDEESGSNYAWVQNFSNGYQLDIIGKTSVIYVRVVFVE